MKIMKIDLLDRVHNSPGAMPQLIAECGRLQDVRANLLDEYHVSPERLERDLTGQVVEFSAKGLLFVENAAESPASPLDVV